MNPAAFATFPIPCPTPLRSKSPRSSPAGETSGAAERANYQMFLSELCAIISVPRPDPTSPDPAKDKILHDQGLVSVRR